MRRRIVETSFDPSGLSPPRALLIGRCLEVWADPADGFPQHSARIRFSSVRSWWLRNADVSRAEGWKLIPGGAPWSVEYLIYRGQAERIGRPVSEVVAERLASAGASAADLDALRQEATHLHNLVASAAGTTNRKASS